MAIAAESPGGPTSTGGSEGLRYRALRYMDGGNAEENEGYFADGENDPSSTPLNKFDILKLSCSGIKTIHGGPSACRLGYLGIRSLPR